MIDLLSLNRTVISTSHPITIQILRTKRIRTDRHGRRSRQRVIRQCIQITTVEVRQDRIRLACEHTRHLRETGPGTGDCEGHVDGIVVLVHPCDVECGAGAAAG